jgi:predicted RND superfamily exporter protein
MASMGQLLTLGIVVTLAATLITLPALLTLTRRP